MLSGVLRAVVEDKERGGGTEERALALERSPRCLHPCSALPSPAAKFGKVRKLPPLAYAALSLVLSALDGGFLSPRAAERESLGGQKKHVARFGGGI